MDQLVALGDIFGGMQAPTPRQTKGARGSRTQRGADTDDSGPATSADPPGAIGKRRRKGRTGSSATASPWATAGEWEDKADAEDTGYDPSILRTVNKKRKVPEVDESQPEAEPRKRKKKKKKAGDSDSGNEFATEEVAVAPPTKKPRKKKLRTREEVEDWDWKKGNIHRDILRGLKEMGITTPTPIQVAVLRPALGGRCILAAAQTGSGKTLAFGVPILHRIMLDIARSGDAKDQRLLFCLVLTPTRELALQIHEHLKKAGRYTPILTLPIVGGLSEQKQLRLLLKSRPHIMVATPGRLSKLLTEESIPFLQQSLSLQLRYLVIDEGDRMLEMHHFNDLDVVLKQLSSTPADRSWGQLDSMKGILKEGDRAHEGKAANQVRTFTSCFEEFDSLETFMNAERGNAEPTIRYLLPSLEGDASQAARKQASTEKGRVRKLARRQVFITSATLTLATRWKDGTNKIRKWNPEDPDAAYMHALVSRVGLPLRAFKMIDVNPEHQMADSLKELKVDCTVHDRDHYLYYFLTEYPGRTIIFVNAISSVRRLHAILRILQLPCYPLHAQMDQKQRLKNYEAFKADPRGIAVATDVIGRGTDIPEVKYVVHYQFPRNTEIYLHRSGRTARAHKPGLALTLLTPPDVSTYKQICHSLGYKGGLEEFPIDAAVLVHVRSRVGLALEIDKIANTRSKMQSELDWFTKNAQELDLDVDEEVAESLTVDPRERKLRDRKMRALEQQLRALLAQPMHSIKGAYLTSASNLIRKEQHLKALTHRVNFTTTT